MTAVEDAAYARRFGLSCFDAVDTTGRPTLDDEEDLAGIFPEIGLRLGDSSGVESGTLHITSTRIVWISTTEPAKGYFVCFPNITMHAISQEPEPCIYAQLEALLSEDEEEEEGDDEELYPEIRLVPKEADKLQAMFERLCECAALNPDSEDDDDSEDGGFYYNEEEAMNGIGADGRAAMLNHLDSLLDDTDANDLEELTREDPDRFEDPDEEPEKESNATTPPMAS